VLKQLKSNPKIGTIYFGRRGGAESHFLLTKQLMESDCDLKTVISSSNEKLNEYLKNSSRVMSIQFPSARIGILRLLISPRFCEEIIDFMGDRDIVYFYLPHILDNRVASKLLKRNIYVVRSIHDPKRHPGDIWPTRFSIKRQVKFSSEVIFHSEFVASQFPKTKIFKILALPTPKRIVSQNFGTPYILFIGRFRRYKGIKKLIKAWEILSPKYPNLQMILAGSGKLPQIKDLTRIQIVGKWLSPVEMDNLIDGCECLVFPYKEASQSGPLSHAISANKNVVITNAGALLEQAKKGSYVLVEYSVESIAWGIEMALGLKPSQISETSENRELANYLHDLSKNKALVGLL